MADGKVSIRYAYRISHALHYGGLLSLAKLERREPGFGDGFGLAFMNLAAFRLFFASLEMAPPVLSLFRGAERPPYDPP